MKESSFIRCSVQSDLSIANSGEHLRLVTITEQLAGLSPQSKTQEQFALNDLLV